MTYQGVVTSSSAQTLISQQTLASASATLQFGSGAANLPQTYKHLLLEMACVSTAASKVFIRLQKNNASAHVWVYQEFPSASGSVTGSNGSAASFWQVGAIPGSTTITSFLRVYIPNYTLAQNTTFAATCHLYDPGASAAPNSMASGWQGTAVGVQWLNLSLSSGSFATNTVASLYGIS